MKKKIISFLVLFSAFFFIGNVQAIEIDKDDIPAGSYVIGTHLFTREVTDTYDGTLTVQRIMLAAQTIDSFDINDMVIYYKLGSGVWKNALTKENVTMDDKLNIDYKNTELSQALEAPTLHYGMGSDYVHYLDISENGAYGFEGSSSLDILSGLEFYEKLGETYNKLDVEIEGWGAWIEVNAGESRTIVAKVYLEDSKGNKVYSDYSEEFVVSAPVLEAPTLTTGTGGNNKTDLSIVVEGEYAVQGATDVITGVQFFEKQSAQQGDRYVLLDDVQKEEYFTTWIEVNAGESRTIVAQVYREDSKGNRAYSEYSNEILINPIRLEKTAYTGENGLWFDVYYSEAQIMDGAELYYYDGNSWNLIDEASYGYSARYYEETGTYGIIIECLDENCMTSSSYKARLYKLDPEIGDKIYTDFSNTVSMTRLEYSGPTIEDGIRFDVYNSEVQQMYGVELYYHDGNSWNLIDETFPGYSVIYDDELGAYSINIKRFDENYRKYMYKARLYKNTSNGKEYTEFSSPVETEYMLLHYLGSEGGEGWGQLSFAVEYDVDLEITGVELYYQKDEYNWVLIDETKVELIESTGGYSNEIVYTFEDYPGTETRFKIRLYSDTTEGRKYTEFSPSTDLSNPLG